MAAFSDTEQSTDNTVQAGTLDLKVDGGDSAGTTLSVSNVAPGDTGSATRNVSNSGSINGTLTVNVTNVVDDENGQNEPESEFDNSSGASEGELSDTVNVTIYVDGTEIATGTLSSIEGEYNVGELASGDSATVTVEYSVPGDAGNEIQSDIVTFDLVFELEQSSS